MSNICNWTILFENYTCLRYKCLQCNNYFVNSKNVIIHWYWAYIFLYFIIPKWSKNKYAEKKIDFVVLFFFYCKHYKWSSPVGSYRDVLKSTKYHLWFPLFHTKIVIHICVDFRNWQGWLEIPGYRSVETFNNLQKKTKKRGLHDIIMMSDWNFHIKRKISKK